MELINLKAVKRTTQTKSDVKSLRRNEMIPAILYGMGTNPEKITLAKKEFEEAFKNRKTLEFIANLTIDTDNPKTVVLKEFQRNNLGANFIHLDFYAANLKKKMKAKVIVELTGKAIGLDKGGKVQLVQRLLNIKCLPLDIPEKIFVDISNLDAGKSIHIKDLKAPEGLEFIFDENFAIVTCFMPKAEKTKEETKSAEGDKKVEDKKAAAPAKADKKPADDKKAPEKKAADKKPAADSKAKK